MMAEKIIFGARFRTFRLIKGVENKPDEKEQTNANQHKMRTDVREKSNFKFA